MTDRAPLRRIVCALVAAAFMAFGASALSTAVRPASASANGINCTQIAYEPGPWGSAPGRYLSCTDDQVNCVLPPDGSNDGCPYMHRPR